MFSNAIIYTPDKLESYVEVDAYVEEAIRTPSPEETQYLLYEEPEEIDRCIRRYLYNHALPEESVYFLDVGEIERLYDLWEERFLNIQPYYAIKCNPDIGLLEKLASLGANFDCASIAEIDRVLEIGVSPDRIIFANPCKRKIDIVSAYIKGVRIATFDTETELDKIAEACPKMKCVLRIYAKDPEARCQFAHKFGCPPERWIHILETAKKHGLDIIGISFHVGSGASSGKAYTEAIRQAREFRDLATEYGHTIQLIDIGGGFVSHALQDIPEAIQSAIETYFPPEIGAGCHFIAEPGRFFAETSGYLATNIIGIRKTETTRDYWITDSLYGSFNCIFYDHYSPSPEVFQQDKGTHKHKTYKTTFYGPTCDGLDKIAEIESFPELSLNDWVLFRRMGAYTIAGACNFNGIPFLNTATVYLLQQ